MFSTSFGKKKKINKKKRKRKKKGTHTHTYLSVKNRHDLLSFAVMSDGFVDCLRNIVQN